MVGCCREVQFMSLFGDRLRSEREARGWTQVDTAKKLNVNNATLGNYEAERSFAQNDAPHATRTRVCI